MELSANVGSKKSLLERMFTSSANSSKDQAIFVYLRDLENIDREWGEKYPALRTAKDELLQNIRGEALTYVRKSIGILYDIFEEDGLPASLKTIIQNALTKARTMVNAA